MRRVLVLLLLGALLNLAVSWSVFLSSAITGAELFLRSKTVTPVPTWPTGAPKNWPPPTSAAIHTMLGQYRFSRGHFEETTSSFVRALPDLYWVRDCSIGLPYRSLSFQLFGSRTDGMRTDLVAVNGGVLIWADNDPETWLILPLRPLPLGFAANTLFYAVVLWSPGALKRWNRRRKGRCERCGYDVGGQGACPECGRAVRRPGTGGQAASGTPVNGPEATHG